MYDPITRALIASAPPLKGLERARLPEELAQAYATLVSARLRLQEVPDDPEWPKEIARVRRLANTYETYAAALAERDDQEAAAFVAATAHGIVQRAVSLRDPSTAATVLASNFISPDISACLLFLAAGYFADALEVARRFQIPKEAREVDVVGLQRMIQHLVAGRLGAAINARREMSTDRAQRDVVARLYLDIADAVEVLCTEIRDGTTLDSVARLRSAQQRATLPILVAGRVPATVATLAGPHHLATLLLQAAPSLLRRRMSIIPAPLGTGASWENFKANLSHLRPFLWRSHENAVESGFLNPGTSAVLSFPTGSGKSTMAELKVASTLSTDKHILYLVPTHALVSQVTADLKRAFPDTGVADSIVFEADYTEVEEQQAQIAVMTPERALTILSSDPATFDGVGLIVMDECHLLHPGEEDRLRRNIDAMFCLLSSTAHCPDADVLLMSAMMQNHMELAAWLADLTGRPCLGLSTDWKPTRQMRGCVVFGSEEVEALNALIARAKAVKTTKGPPAGLVRSLTAQPQALFGLKQTWSRDALDFKLLPLLNRKLQLKANKDWWLTPNRNEVSAELATEFADRGLPVLVFAESPRLADSLADAIAEKRNGTVALLGDETRLREIAVDELGSDADLRGLTNGLAASHHGLLLPTERRLVESVYKRGDQTIALVGTPTLAQGVNLPAEVVIVSGDDRYNPVTKKSTPLNAEELLNAVARAGRPGFASVGIVLVVPGRVVSVDWSATTVGKRWLDLQKDVFSKLDQCLVIDDPLERMLDLVQTTPNATDARYFLNRLPTDGSTVKQFLARSFGAYRASQAMQREAFDRKAFHVAALREAASPEDEWVDAIAVTSGVDIEFARSLASQFEDNPGYWDCTTVQELCGRFFQWLREDSVRGHALFRGSVSKSSLGPEDMEDLVEMWIGGSTLRELESRLSDKVVDGCWKAREFVLRRVPDISYGLGVVAHAYRLKVGEGGDMPTVLACGAECLKRGFSSPEQLAVAYSVSEDHSRREYAEILSRLELEPGEDREPFSKTLSRVRSALSND